MDLGALSTLGKSSTNWAPILVCLSSLNQSFCNPGCSGTPSYPMLLTPTLEWQACVSYNFISNQLTPLQYPQGLVLGYYHENVVTKEVNDTITWGVMQRRIPKVTQSLGTLDRIDMPSTIFGCKNLDGMLLAWMKQGPQNCSGSPNIRKTIHYNKKGLVLNIWGLEWPTNPHVMICFWDGEAGKHGRYQSQTQWKDPGIQGTMW